LQVPAALPFGRHLSIKTARDGEDRQRLNGLCGHDRSAAETIGIKLGIAGRATCCVRLEKMGPLEGVALPR